MVAPAVRSPCIAEVYICLCPDLCTDYLYGFFPDAPSIGGTQYRSRDVCVANSLIGMAVQGFSLVKARPDSSSAASHSLVKASMRAGISLRRHLASNAHDLRIRLLLPVTSQVACSLSQPQQGASSTGPGREGACPVPLCFASASNLDGADTPTRNGIFSDFCSWPDSPRFVYIAPSIGGTQGSSLDVICMANSVFVMALHELSPARPRTNRASAVAVTPSCSQSSACNLRVIPPVCGSALIASSFPSAPSSRIDACLFPSWCAKDVNSKTSPELRPYVVVWEKVALPVVAENEIRAVALASLRHFGEPENNLSVKCAMLQKAVDTGRVQLLCAAKAGSLVITVVACGCGGMDEKKVAGAPSTVALGAGPGSGGRQRSQAHDAAGGKGAADRKKAPQGVWAGGNIIPVNQELYAQKECVSFRLVLAQTCMHMSAPAPI